MLYERITYHWTDMVKPRKTAYFVKGGAREKSATPGGHMIVSRKNS